MKKTYIRMLGILIAACTLSFAVSCNDDDDPTPTIRLKSPEADAELDLTEGNVRFEWHVTGVIPGGYTFVLATDETMVDQRAYELPATAFSREMNNADLDILLKEWGYKQRELARIYWKVESTEGGTNNEKLRPVNIRRLEADAVQIILTSPAENAFVDLDDTENVTFAWSPDSDIDIYSLELAAERDGDKLPVSLGVDTDNISGNSVTVSAAALNDAIVSLGMTNTIVSLYWKVRSKTTDVPGVSESRRVRFGMIGAQGLAAVSNLEAVPGYERVRLSWDVDDDRVTKVDISWNGGSREVVRESGQYQMEAYIDLAEGTHTFSLVAKDDTDRVSEAVTTGASVYGAAFAAGLANREIELTSLTRDGMSFELTTIQHQYLLYSELEYTDGDGVPNTMRIGNDQTQLTLTGSDITGGTTALLKSYYAPEEEVLDYVTPDPAFSLFMPEHGMMDKTKHAKVANVAHDMGEMSGFGYELLFDDITDGGSLNMWHTAGAEPNTLIDDPILLTIDLGESAYLSSLVTWGRYGGLPGNLRQDADGGSYWAYGSYNFRKFEVWGSNVAPADVTNSGVWSAEGTWKTSGDWTLLTDCEIVRPSGCPVSSYKDEDLTLYPGAYPPSDEDVLAAADGFEFTVPFDKPAVRYIRLVVRETWDNQNRKRVSQAELSFYKYTRE